MVDGNYAYVTLRSNSFCAGNVNALDIINVADIGAPFLEQSIAMQEPKGLGTSNGKLFVCDGAGLKIFEVLETPQLGLLATQEDIVCNDVILNKDILIAIGDCGIFQYDFATLPPCHQAN